LLAGKFNNKVQSINLEDLHIDKETSEMQKRGYNSTKRQSGEITEANIVDQ